ncbi:MAG: hypothetical protein AAGF30_14805 [Pseudomonadota bacterium]
MKAIVATLALALTATFAIPADAQQTRFNGGETITSTRTVNEPLFQIKRRPSRVERFDMAYPNSGLSRAAKIAIVINDESADTSTERRLPQTNRFRNNPSLGEVFGLSTRNREVQARPARSVRADRQRSGNYIFLRRTR